MNKNYLLIPFLIAVSFFVSAQKSQILNGLNPLSQTDLEKLSTFPEYKVNISDQAVTLPISVDNTTQPYFRPLFNQSGLECGQAASIGLNFTYEMAVARNLPANVAQNQYATHFAYDFINGGSDAGVSYFESWEIVKRCGNPTVADYGGLSTGGASRWMTGYNSYYNAMHNRISDVYAINASDVAGLTTLKNWIYNHSNTASIGGLANIYIQYKTPDAQLAAGTPEAGKWVIVTWGGSTNHAVTLVGYNDSIRYDYNGDGIYTNTIDINGDGMVNVKDWEIGGFKLANTYGGINNWGDQGFSFVMYKTFADNSGSGGIWNHSAHIVKVKQDVSPKLTYKITLKHTSRNKIKIMAGVAQNTLATEPDDLLNLPIFDLQGGDKFMLGGNTEADKTIEFGIDATPLLSKTEPGQAAKFFFTVQENDPSNAATGQIISFDLVDYSGVTTIISCPSSNVPLIENGLTQLSIIYTPIHNRPSITNTSIPEAKIYEPFSQQMNATGGTPAYRWKLFCDYSETPVPTPFPTVTAQQLTITNTSSGFAEVNLPFEFPFYGKKYSKLYANVDGYLMFQPDLTPWTFLIYEKTYFKNTRNISPYMSKPLTFFPSEGDGIWYEGNQNYAIFRWKSGMYGSGPTTDLNFAVKIFPDGKLEFYYGSIVSNDWVTWNMGISNGDGVNYRFGSISDSIAQPTANSMFRFTTPTFPYEMGLSDDGVFSGTPTTTCSNVPIKFYAEDNNNLYTTKTLNFSTKGITIEYTVTSGSDSIIEYGETAMLTAKLTNIGSTPLNNVNLSFLVTDPYISLIDSTQLFGLLNPGQTITVTNAISFHVSDQVPNNHTIITTNQAVATEDIFTRIIPLTANSPELSVSAINILDGNNNILMPGENGVLHITIKNGGGSAATNINTILSAIDPMISIIQGNASIPIINKNGTQSIDFQISVSASCPLGHVGLAGLLLSADHNYTLSDSVYFMVGQIAEDFETNNFTRFAWQLGGNANWETTNTLPSQGNYCSASGTILDNQLSSMYITLNVLSASEISFYRKVSSENNYDYLTFLIDGVEQGKWSGEVAWSKVTYTVTEGTHTFTWRYSKDVNVVAGSDKAWVDYIVWPPYSDLLLVANAGADDYVCVPTAYQLQASVINAGNLFWTSVGDGYFSNTNIPNPTYTPGINDQNTGSVELTIHVGSPTAQSVTDQMFLTVYQAPAAMAGLDASICSGSSFTVTGASASSQGLLWSTAGDGVFNSNSILSPTYTPGATDITNGQVFLALTGFGTGLCGDATDTLQLTIHPSVYSNAGTDQSIPFGTSTILNGQATGGTGNFTISWTPADKLTSSNILNPSTIVLDSSVEFTLNITDPATLCTASDNIFVNVSGSPLSVSVSSEPERICVGGFSQLSAFAGGGTGNYTYSWSSVPVGFSSTILNPLVNPATTTIYTVLVNDGSNSLQASTTVSVDSIAATPSQPIGSTMVNPLINPETIYTTTLSANATEYSWVLSPAVAGSVSHQGNTCSIIWDTQFNGICELSVAGINACGSGVFSEALTINTSPFIGLDELPSNELIEVWPNPVSETLNLKSKGQIINKYSLYNSKGKAIYELEDVLGKGEITSINMGLYPSGIYLLNVKLGNSMLLYKIIKH